MDRELREPTKTQLAEWKELAQKGEAPKDTCVYKGYESEIKLSDDRERSIDFVISTGSVDRDGDIVVPEGGDWSAFLRNGPGPVLFAHDYRSVPIAGCETIVADESTIRARANFPTKEELGIPEGAPSLSETVFRMIKNRLGLKNASIGFNPEEWTFDDKRFGFNFLKWEGLEWSVVPVPANRDAIAQASAKGIDLTPVWHWATRALDDNPDLAVIERSKLEELRSQVKETPSVFDIGSVNKSIEGLVKKIDSIEARFEKFGESGVRDTNTQELRERDFEGLALEAIAKSLEEKKDADYLSRTGKLPH